MKDQWKLRRRMAIGSYIFGLVIFPVAYVLFPVLSELSVAYYSLIMVVLTAYYSLVTYHDIKDKKK